VGLACFFERPANTHIACESLATIRRAFKDGDGGDHEGLRIDCLVSGKKAVLTSPAPWRTLPGGLKRRLPPCKSRIKSAPVRLGHIPAGRTKDSPAWWRSAAPRGLDRGDVDLRHGHHGVERTLGGGGVGVGDRSRQGARGDLPGQAPFV